MVMLSFLLSFSTVLSSDFHLFQRIAHNILLARQCVWAQRLIELELWPPVSTGGRQTAVRRSSARVTGLYASLPIYSCWRKSKCLSFRRPNFWKWFIHVMATMHYQVNYVSSSYYISTWIYIVGLSHSVRAQTISTKSKYCSLYCSWIYWNNKPTLLRLYLQATSPALWARLTISALSRDMQNCGSVRICRPKPTFINIFISP